MSGKTARRLRKKHIFSKKTLAVCAGLCISCTPVTAGGEFLVSLFPHFTKPFGESHEMEYGIGGGLKATYRPLKNLNVFAQGDYLSMALPGVSPISIIQGGIGTGYHLDVTDRISFDFNVNVGAYNAKAEKSVAGITAGAALTFTYKISSSIYADVNASANHYAAKPSPLMMINAGISPGITFNITEMFNNKTNIGIELNELYPVFPVLYSWYENNPFGKVSVTNNEDTDITDVTISFFQPQYMAHAKECATIKKIKRDETVSVDLVAFFNEQMLELTEKTDTSSYIIVNYSRLGKKLSQSYALDVPVYGRNNMSWDDDRRAAVFVSSKDPAAMQFGKYTASIVRDNLRMDVPVNIQYALGIFEALNQFGLNYVVDPSSAFEDNVGTSSIDFLQFPYQTLMYRGGDCDDLSILVCSLFEAVGIRTAFITVPGHIFMAFDSGITPEMAKTTFRNTSDFIFIDDEVWVPLEITLSDEGFYKACRYGAREWNTAAAQGTAALYKMNDSWQLYQPISVPGATAYFNMPESNAIYTAFVNGIEKWSHGELKAIVSDENIRFAMIKESEVPEDAEVILKENPDNIIALANSTVVVAPAAIREEELEEDEDLAFGNGDDDEEEDELLEDIIPLDYAIATLQTDVTVKTSDTTEITVVEPVETAADTETTADVELPETTIIAAGFETSEEDPDPFAEIQALAADFISSTPAIAKAETPVAEPSNTPAVEPVETIADLSTSETTADVELSASTEPFETVDEFTAALEEAAAAKDVVSTSSGTRTRKIIIISSITTAAVLAAGIIIYKKKKREEGDK